MSSESFTEYNSFKFGEVDMWDSWQLRILRVHDFLKPKLRPRKVQIPQRDGEYDFGAEYYDERLLTLECIRMENITRHEEHELALVLSGKNRIRLYDDPEKYYIGRIYTEPELTQIRNGGMRVTLEFTCEPFLYGQTKTEAFVNQQYVPNYAGTAPTPTYIVIRNAAVSGNVTNIRITQTDALDNI